MPHRTVSQIIENQQLLALSSTTSVSEAAERMRQQKVGAVAVVADGRLVGVFTERDALFRVVAEGRDARTTPLAEVMLIVLAALGVKRAFPRLTEFLSGHDTGAGPGIPPA